MTVLPGTPRFLANSPASQLLDISDWLGQRAATFRYDVVDARSGIRLGTVAPLRSTIPVLTHNTQNTICRTLTGFNLGTADTASLNPVTDRIVPYMVISTPQGELTFPLGRYMYDSSTLAVSTGGDNSANSLFDETFIIDQPLDTGFTAVSDVDAIRSVPRAIELFLAPFVEAGLIRYQIQDSAAAASGSWAAGTSGGSVLTALAKQGAYFQPWFNNEGILTFELAFNPADVPPDFDYDQTKSVVRNTISTTSDLLHAYNRFTVINNSGNTSSAAYGSYDVPSSAPFSFANRGFRITKVIDDQGAFDSLQAQAMAKAYAEQEIVNERTTLSTAPDPRHDSYDVIRWQGGQWLEIAWSMQLQEGGPTVRQLRKAYAA